MNKKIIAFMFIAVALMLSSCINTTPRDKNEHTISVTGTSKLTVEPDQVEVSAGVTIVKPTSEEAQNEADKVINNIIDGLRYKGIDEKDIETAHLSLQEDFSWDNGKRISNGWRATQRLTIKSSDLHKAGTIVDVLTSNGANQIDSIRFTLSEEKEQEYKKEALADAAKNAKEKAETLVEGVGGEIKSIKSISDGSFNYIPRMYSLNTALGTDMVKEASNIMPSDVDVNARVSVIYYIK